MEHREEVGVLRDPGDSDRPFRVVIATRRDGGAIYYSVPWAQTRAFEKATGARFFPRRTPTFSTVEAAGDRMREIFEERKTFVPNLVVQVSDARNLQVVNRIEDRIDAATGQGRR